MGVILALDSSTSHGSAAVGEGGRVRAEVSFDRHGGHSAVLLPAIDQALALAGAGREEVEGVVVGGGPGSFTGVRIAAATGKGIAAALEVPMYAYSGLLAAAVGGWGAGIPVCALFDARRRDVYAACYRFGEQGVEVRMPPTALTVDELLDRLSEAGDILFLGEGAELHRAELAARPGARVAPSHLGAPRAAALVWLADLDPGLGRIADLAGWEPEYVRASGAERIAQAARAGG